MSFPGQPGFSSASRMKPNSWVRANIARERAARAAADAAEKEANAAEKAARLAKKAALRAKKSRSTCFPCRIGL